MSRSYRKFLSRDHHEFDPPDWSGFRSRERRCISKELHNHYHGDVIFPRYYGSDDKSWCCSTRSYYSKKEIRDDYFEEIRNILNGYQDRRYRGEYDDYEEIFTNDFYRIKKGESPDGNGSRFEWLNSRQAKEEIKNWDGDPLDILYHLTNNCLIEKAVHRECKRMSLK